MSTQKPSSAAESSNKRKRPSNNNERFQPAWKRARELPDFLDASASVSASTFGARRLPEIKALHRKAMADVAVTQPEDSLKSSGCKTSSRHLRRRVTSYKSRKRHRYPSANYNQQQQAAGVVSRRSFRKNKSNLFGAHESWWRTKAVQQDDEKEKLSPENMERKEEYNNTREKENASNSNKKKNSRANTTKSPPLDWLTTHLWHAKRFHMADLWGWQIPMVHTNRGPKAALRLIRESKTLIQDVTYSMAARPILCQCNDTVKIQSALRRLCPDFALTLDNNKPMIDRGQGILYQLDQFPDQSIGPITWMVTTQSMSLMASAPEKSLSYQLYFWAHPSIHSALWNELEALLEQGNSQTLSNLHLGFPTMTSDGSSSVGMACFRLRGIHATSTLQKVLNEADDSNQSLLQCPEWHLKQGPASSVSATVDPQHAPQYALDDKSSPASADKNWVGGHKILLLSQQMRNPQNLPQNAPAVGYDLYCDAKIASSLFVALVVKGGACPIGLVEEAYLHLECQPPIAGVFPRDFVETEEGREYWQGSNDERRTLRLCLEQGEAGGRVPVPTIKIRVRETASQTQKAKTKISIHRLGKINWSDFVREEEAVEEEAEDEKGIGGGDEGIVEDGKGGEEGKTEDEKGTDKDDKGKAQDSNNNDDNSSGNENLEDGVVMMRGMFGKPLVDALAGTGMIAQVPTSKDKPKRRNRRRVRHPNELCHVVPISREQAEAQTKQCTMLLQSLSLPAVIACKLQVVGPGTLKPCEQIYAYEKDAKTSSGSLLGYVTAGSFSVARGRSHGTGVVGASRFLRTIIRAHSDRDYSHNALAVVDSDGTRDIQLVVLISNGGTTMKATLDLQL